MSSTFLSPLIVSLSSRGLWKLESSLRYRSARLEAIIEVPVGFKTDFASVPKLPFAYILAKDHAHASAVIHDYLVTQSFLDRSTADTVFLEAMKVEGVVWWRRYMMYAAVSLATLYGGFW